MKEKLVRINIFLKENWICILIGFLVAYMCTFGVYVLTSQGVTHRPMMLQMRRFIPISLLMSCTYAYLRDKVQYWYWFSFSIIAIAWITVYPITYKITYGNTVPHFGWFDDILLGGMSWSGLALLAYYIKNVCGAKVAALSITTVELILMIIPLGEVFYYYVYESCVSQAAVMAIIQTNYLEAKEFLIGVIGYPILIAIIFVYIVTTVLFYKINFYSFNSAVSLNDQVSLLLILLISVGTLGYGVPKGLRGSGFYSIAYAANYYFKDMAEFKKIHTRTLLDLEVIPPVKRLSKPSTVILVIGESASRHYMSAYYETERNTTPWLRKQKQNQNFTIFNHAYTSWGQTVPALERALTEKNQYNAKEFKKSATIIDIAKSAGYRTYWYSNQGDIGDADTPITMVARTADICKFTNADANVIKYDASLIPYLKEVNPNDNNFVVLHLMGSHTESKYRYPKEFSKWSDYDKSDYVLEYDNTLTYTDWVLQQIYEYGINNLNMQAMIYFSDHGALPDRKRHPDETGFKHLSIPFFCYLGDDYKSVYPESSKIIKENEHQYFTNDLMYEFVCGLLNIKSNCYDETNSLASEKYKWNRDSLRTALGKIKLTDDNNP